MIKGGMGNLMKQAQQMQEKMQKAQEELQALWKLLWQAVMMLSVLSLMTA